MDIEQLTYFLMVAEMGNITQAAARLNVSQPALSKTIKRMETELGIPLFDRLGNRIELNACGMAMRSYAEKVLMDTKALQRKVVDLKARKRETVSIGYSFPTSEPIWLQECARDFFFQNPGVALRLTQMDSTMVGEYLRSGKVSIAVSMHPYKAADLIWKEVRSDPMGVLMTSVHPLAKKEKVRMRDLMGEQFYCTDPTTETSVLLRECCEMAGFSPDIVFEGSHAMFINECIWNGLGLSFVSGPVYSFERYNYDSIYVNPKIVFRKIWDDFCLRPAGIAVLRHAPLDEATHLFYDMLIGYATDQDRYFGFTEDGPVA